MDFESEVLAAKELKPVRQQCPDENTGGLIFFRAEERGILCIVAEHAIKQAKSIHERPDTVAYEFQELYLKACGDCPVKKALIGILDRIIAE